MKPHRGLLHCMAVHANMRERLGTILTVLHLSLWVIHFKGRIARAIYYLFQIRVFQGSQHERRKHQNPTH